MSQHLIKLEWSSGPEPFDLATYSRAHTVTFKNGAPVRFSAAPAYRGDADCVDPEEAFVASLASCHMLTFLAVACRRGFVVTGYLDEAVGHLEKNEQGKLAITRVELCPRVTFDGDGPDDAALSEMHEKAHADCFIANSVRTQTTVTAPD